MMPRNGIASDAINRLENSMILTMMPRRNVPESQIIGEEE
jgi:hypothetical protein